jgi:hypothetical protein
MSVGVQRSSPVAAAGPTTQQTPREGEGVDTKQGLNGAGEEGGVGGAEDGMIES